MRDFFGRTRSAQHQDATVDAPRPYEQETVVSGTTEVVYTRFFDKGDQPCAIWKQTYVKNEDGVVTSYKHEYAYQPWADRATTTYIPINDCWLQ